MHVSQLAKIVASHAQLQPNSLRKAIRTARQPFIAPSLAQRGLSHWKSSRRAAGGGLCRASAKGEQLVNEGTRKYNAGDRVGALQIFEEALREDLSREQRVAAQYNSACVHAYYGDAELAQEFPAKMAALLQISLKEAMFGGLDFAQALAGEVPGLVRMQASAQVQNQLRRFASSVQKAIIAAEAEAAAAEAPQPTAAGSGTTATKGRGIFSQDVAERLQTETVGIDSSVGGMLRRVTLLLLALAGLGAGLFYVGLKYAFPDTY